MQAFKLSLCFLAAIITLLLSTVSAIDTRHLADATSAVNGGVPIAAVVGIAAAAAVAVVVLVAIKVRGGRRPKHIELQEVVISPSHVAAQPLSTKKQFVYTAHI